MEKVLGFNSNLGILQKEKVKVYIDEKYHHATDPSIRPKETKSLGNNEATSPSSKASTLVRKDSSRPATAANTASDAEEGKAADYGKNLKDIPRSIWRLLTNEIYLVTCLGNLMLACRKEIGDSI